jgi:hypothetical protein
MNILESLYRADMFGHIPPDRRLQYLHCLDDSIRIDGETTSDVGPRLFVINAIYSPDALTSV